MAERYTTSLLEPMVYHAKNPYGRRGAINALYNDIIKKDDRMCTAFLLDAEVRGLHDTFRHVTPRTCNVLLIRLPTHSTCYIPCNKKA